MSAVKFGFTAQQVISQGRVAQSEIDLLRDWLSSQSLPKLTDEQIVLFLLSCCNDQEATKTTIKSFYSVIKGTPQLFSNRKLQRGDLQKQLNIINVCVFPERTDDGYAIIYHSLHDTLYSNYEMAPVLILALMTLEAALYDRPPTGLIILYDMQGGGLMHMTRLRLGLLQPYCRYLQECLPVRLMAIHILNTVYFVDKLMTLLKPFLKEEVRKKLNFHPPGIDMELLLPKRCLPQDYGGDLPPIRVLHQQNVQKLMEMEPYFEAEELQRRSIN